MLSTTLHEHNRTIAHGGGIPDRFHSEIVDRYQSLVDAQRLDWTAHHRLEKLLGKGGQGVVYLSQRRGADNFTLPIAIKIFSPERCLILTQFS